jgi:hypothetical protein
LCREDLYFLKAASSFLDSIPKKRAPLKPKMQTSWSSVINFPLFDDFLEVNEAMAGKQRRKTFLRRDASTTYSYNVC